MEVNRFEVHQVGLDSTIGSEIKKTRRCVVVSPDEMNHHIHTVIVAPMTTKGQPYPSRVSLLFKGKQAQIALDQLQTVDTARLIRKVGELDQDVASEVLAVLAEMFAP